MNGTENKYQTFQGQELEEELGKNTLAYQWRDYDPAIARFNKIDRFAEKYYSSTPYHFADNNPIFFREIAGDSIAAGSQADFNRNRTNVTNEQSRLTRRRDRLVNRGASQSRVDALNERIDGLGETINNLNDLESSAVTYKLTQLDPNTNSEGSTTYDTSDNTVSINYIRGSTSNFVHEATHAHQFDTGNIAFPAAGGDPVGVDLFDEVAAYKAQYAYDPSSVSRLTSSSQINNMGNINATWVRNIQNTVTNTFPYQAQHVGIRPVNVNTTVRAMRIAYPSVNFGNMNNALTLRQIIPGIISNR